MDELDLGATIKGFNPGQRLFSRYTLKRMLGRGGMGVVWLAHDDELGRDIALKFLPETVTSDRGAIADLKRETRRALELTHPHIVRIYDFVSDAQTAGISMEYVAGDTLSALRADHPNGHFEVADLENWTRQLCKALDYAHGKAKVVHRDLKPANLMIDADGDLKIADFGISASITDTVSRTSRQVGSSGTPVYMSPQQMMGEKAAPTDDIYSLGATLYDLLTGKPPFHLGRIEAQVLNKVPVSMEECRCELDSKGKPIPPAWEEVIAACLAKDAKDRPQSAGAVAFRLGLSERAPEATAKYEEVVNPAPSRIATSDSIREDLPRERKRSNTLRIVGIAAGVLLLSGLGWYFGIQAPEKRRLAELQRLETLRLANARGGLSIRTDPTGAEVRVGGARIERSPATFGELRLGNHEVTIRMEGYETRTLNLNVEENRFTEAGEIKLVKSVGAISITTESDGVEFDLQSKRLVAAEHPAVTRTGKTPALLNELPFGSYSLRLYRRGWSDQVSEIEVSRKETLPVTCSFPGGGLKLTTEPSGLTWTIREFPPGVKDMTTTGRTPHEFKELPTGRYRIEFRREGGWVPENRDAEVARGKTVTAAASFPSGGMALTTKPEGLPFTVIRRVGSEILMERTGSTPATLTNLPAGRYAVEIERESLGYPHRLTVDVVEGEMAAASAEFLGNAGERAVGVTEEIEDLNLHAARLNGRRELVSMINAMVRQGDFSASDTHVSFAPRSGYSTRLAREWKAPMDATVELTKSRHGLLRIRHYSVTITGAQEDSLEIDASNYMGQEGEELKLKQLLEHLFGSYSIGHRFVIQRQRTVSGLGGLLLKGSIR